MKFLRQRRLRCLTTLFLLAFMIKALMPVGFMPGKLENGKTEIVICTGHGPATEIADIIKTPLAPPPEQKEEQNEHPACPYAPVIAQGITELEPVFLPSDLQRGAERFEFADSLPYGAISKPWMAQGPPGFS